MNVMPKAVGRPRNGDVDVAVVKAAQELLLEQGYDRLSLDAVAARAGVSKPAIYRRWAGKVELVVSAVLALTPVPEDPNFGHLRDDLIACGRAYHQSERTHQVLTGLMTAMAHHEELREAAGLALGIPFQHLFESVITKAVQRGDIADHGNLPFIASIFPALAFHQSAALGLPIDDAFVNKVVDECLLPLLVSA